MSKAQKFLAALFMMTVALVAAVTVSACLNTKFRWPDAVKCVPEPESLLVKVEQILAEGVDEQSKLEELALREGKDAVLCAVTQFVESITAHSERIESQSSAGARSSRRLGQG